MHAASIAMYPPQQKPSKAIFSQPLDWRCAMVASRSFSTLLMARRQKSGRRASHKPHQQLQPQTQARVFVTPLPATVTRVYPLVGCGAVSVSQRQLCCGPNINLRSCDENRH